MYVRLVWYGVVWCGVVWCVCVCMCVHKREHTHSAHVRHTLCNAHVANVTHLTKKKKKKYPTHIPNVYVCSCNTQYTSMRIGCNDANTIRGCYLGGGGVVIRCMSYC